MFLRKGRKNFFLTKFVSKTVSFGLSKMNAAEVFHFSQGDCIKGICLKQKFRLKLPSK